MEIGVEYCCGEVDCHSSPFSQTICKRVGNVLAGVSPVTGWSLMQWGCSQVVSKVVVATIVYHILRLRNQILN